MKPRSSDTKRKNPGVIQSSVYKSAIMSETISNSERMLTKSVMSF